MSELTSYDRDQILYYLKWYGGKKIEPTLTDEFWEKASQYGFRDTYYAIRKAAIDKDFTIEIITDLIGKVTKEGDFIVYKSGVKHRVPKDSL